MDNVKSFEFKKGIKTFYRYSPTSGFMEVLYDGIWVGLKKFVNDYYTGIKSYEDVAKEKKQLK